MYMNVRFAWARRDRHLVAATVVAMAALVLGTPSRAQAQAQT